MFFRIISLCLLVCVSIYINTQLVFSMPHKEEGGVSLKQKMLLEFQPYLEAENKERESLPDLSVLGNVSWDYICLTGYYDDGVRTVSRWAKGQDLKEFSFDPKNFTIDDEYFLDAETGLVFLSFSRRFLITIKVDNVTRDHQSTVGKKKRNSPCLPAENIDLVPISVGGRHYLKFQNRAKE